MNWNLHWQSGLASTGWAVPCQPRLPCWFAMVVQWSCRREATAPAPLAALPLRVLLPCRWALLAWALLWRGPCALAALAGVTMCALPGIAMLPWDGSGFHCSDPAAFNELGRTVACHGPAGLANLDIDKYWLPCLMAWRAQ